jgi:hypothetical protein
MEKAQGKDFLEMGQNSERELDRMSKQIQSGDEQNLELSESLRAAIEKTSASKQQQAEASEKSIEDDSRKRARSSGCSIFCRRRLLIEPEVYASVPKWLPQKLLKQLMLQLLKEW